MMRGLRTRVSCLAAMGVALLGSAASSQVPLQPDAHADVFTAQYWDWLYRWERGGAWMFHEGVHPCFPVNGAHQTPQCEILRRRGDDMLNVPWRPLSVNTTLIDHMDFVNVTFSRGQNKLTKDDFIAVYCVDGEGPVTNASDYDFFDYATINDEYLATVPPPKTFEPVSPAGTNMPIVISQLNRTHGSVTFGPLANMRCSYQFRLIRKLDQGVYEVVGESPHVGFVRGKSEPTQVHLAMTNTSSIMRVMWTSGYVKIPRVNYGMSPTNLTNVTVANGSTYNAEDMCSEPSTLQAAMYYRHPGFVYDGVMTGLVPGETYFYRVGSLDGIWSQVFSFNVPPLVGEVPDPGENETQSFFVFGDLGHSVLTEINRTNMTKPERQFENVNFISRMAKSTTKTVMKRIEQDLQDDEDDGNYVGIIHVGDLSYAKGRTYMWDQFGAVIQPVASKLPYMVAVGNHEYDYTRGGAGHDPSGASAAGTNGWHPDMGNFFDDSKGECGVPMIKRFHMPDNGNKVFWFSFATGLTYHIVLSSEHKCDANSPMRVWFENELKKVDRSVTPWVIVHLHRSVYCSENLIGDYQVSKLLRACLEDLMMEHHVDLVFSGHYHAYERTCPVYEDACRATALPNGQELAEAPTHIMVGSGGAELDDVDYMLAPWSLNRQQEYGHGRLHVVNATHARFEFMRARDRNMTDSHWLISYHNWTVASSPQPTTGSPAVPAATTNSAPSTAPAPIPATTMPAQPTSSLVPATNPSPAETSAAPANAVPATQTANQSVANSQPPVTASGDKALRRLQ
ncbi:TPA: hypothetical protein N0F65_003209 [Lagenidium giganteum]|uniref:Purple acid phosphatase n=1 Tax=Lagenidium giganteum TaxID=4803 RepID=A0AAV2Z9N5_9STRA|nr:TPA: hypothetical protein N0F65_003209 [Lagenidium giganteum]